MKINKLHIKRRKKSPDHIFAVYVNTSKMDEAQVNQYIKDLGKQLEDIQKEYNIFHYILPYTDRSKNPMLTIKQIDPVENKEVLQKIKDITFL